MKKSLKAFSLVEMIITLGILSIVFLLTTKTLNTIVKVSAITKYKTQTRSETDFGMELVDRFLSNSNIEDIYLFDSVNWRTYDVTTNQFTNISTAVPDYDSEPVAPATGTEIHVRLSGYDYWTCIGFFKESTEPDAKGYLVKRSVQFTETDTHADCFDYTKFGGILSPIIVLNSDDITVNDFSVTYTKSDLTNNIFYVNLEMEPLFWAPGEDSIERAVIRQSIITTQGLTWY